MCSFVAELEFVCKEHVVRDHKNWKEESKNEANVKMSPHSNPGWLQELKRDFEILIIANCCKRDRDAVNANEKILVFLVSSFSSK